MMLYILALSLLQGDFPGAGSETVSLKEGEDLNLQCSLSSAGSSARQWLNPQGFAIFLNTHRALRDQRYKLIQSSAEELAIRLSNVTVQDEGVYRCFYYGIPFKSKDKVVEVLAAPSNPVLEVSQDPGRSITLSCYTQGCKPQPQISWLLDNGIELPGDTKHKLEADGKKWTTTSRLTVLAHGPNSTASCIVHHQALEEEKLMVSFHFQDLPRTVTEPNPSPAVPEVDTQASEKEQSTVTRPVSDLDSSTVSAPSYPQHSGTEATFSGNVTEEQLSRTEAPLLNGNVTLISTITFEQDQKSEGIKKKGNNLLLPILVAALIFVLLVIVLLFMRKLKKAHGVWKRENDVSEQTLESYKSKSNEDSLSHEKNGHAVNHKSSVPYVTQGYEETTQKDPRDKKNFAISEKQFGCGKETDV